MNAFIEEFDIDNIEEAKASEHLEEVNTDENIIKKSITYNELMGNIYKECNFYKTVENVIKYGDDVILTINGIIKSITSLDRFNKKGYYKINFTVYNTLLKVYGKKDNRIDYSKPVKVNKFNIFKCIQSKDDYINSNKILSTSLTISSGAGANGTIKSNKQIEEIRENMLKSDVYYKIVCDVKLNNYKGYDYISLFKQNLNIKQITLSDYNEIIENLPLTEALEKAFYVYRPKETIYTFNEDSTTYNNFFSDDEI